MHADLRYFTKLRSKSLSQIKSTELTHSRTLIKQSLQCKTLIYMLNVRFAQLNTSANHKQHDSANHMHYALANHIARKRLRQSHYVVYKTTHSCENVPKSKSPKYHVFTAVVSTSLSNRTNKYVCPYDGSAVYESLNALICFSHTCFGNILWYRL